MSQPGTPKSLHAALVNAKAEALYACKPEVYVIEKHVRDFLSQKFSLYTLSDNPAVAETAKALWDAICPDNQSSLREALDRRAL